VKRLLFVTLTGALLATAFTSDAFAKDKGNDSHKRAVARSDSRDSDRRGRDDYDDRRRPDYRQDKVYRVDRHFRQRDVVVVREYYRPYYRPVVHDVRYVYVRHKSLPPGWQKKMRPVPVYVERDLEPIPYGYRRGIIDGHLVVHNDRGFIFDVAVLF
jgi:hypothetical protein